MYTAALIVAVLVIPAIAQQCRAGMFQESNQGTDASQKVVLQLWKFPKTCVPMPACKGTAASSITTTRSTTVSWSLEPVGTWWSTRSSQSWFSSRLQWIPAYNGFLLQKLWTISVSNVSLMKHTSVGWCFREIFWLVNSALDIQKFGSCYNNASETEVLQLQPGCSANWIPYTPGDLFPPEIVIGGYLGDPCFGTPIIHGLTSRGRDCRWMLRHSWTTWCMVVLKSPLKWTFLSAVKHRHIGGILNTSCKEMHVISVHSLHVSLHSSL